MGEMLKTKGRYALKGACLPFFVCGVRRFGVYRTVIRETAGLWLSRNNDYNIVILERNEMER